MKKKKVFITVTLLLLIFVALVYGLTDYIFPKAEPLFCPSGESIVSVSLKDNNGKSVTVKATDYEALSEWIRNARPTRKMSVNDYPSEESYYTADIETAGERYRYYVFKENPEVYIESPYIGIYKADKELIDFFQGYFGL